MMMMMMMKQYYDGSMRWWAINVDLIHGSEYCIMGNVDETAVLKKWTDDCVRKEQQHAVIQRNKQDASSDFSLFPPY